MTEPIKPSAPAAPKAEAIIQQLNLGYNREQDRLMLRVGLSDNSELVLWITYRMAKLIWSLLNGETRVLSANSIKAGTLPEQAVEQFKQELQVAETLRNMDFATEYQPRPEVRNTGALLALNALLLNTSDKKQSLEFLCAEGVSARLGLTKELVLALCNMLQLAAKEAAWDIGTLPSANIVAVEAETPEQKILH